MQKVHIALYSLQGLSCLLCLILTTSLKTRNNTKSSKTRKSRETRGNSEENKNYVRDRKPVLKEEVIVGKRMSKTLVTFPYVAGQYKEVTDHLCTMAAMRTGQGEEINQTWTIHIAGYIHQTSCKGCGRASLSYLL